jgi:hypothetical protein
VLYPIVTLKSLKDLSCGLVITVDLNREVHLASDEDGHVQQVQELENQHVRALISASVEDSDRELMRVFNTFLMLSFSVKEKTAHTGKIQPPNLAQALPSVM